MSPVEGVDPALDRAYSPSSMVGGSAQPFVDQYAARSAQAARTLAGRVRALPGGSLLVAPSGGPTMVFVHGGYWQALSAADSMYLAPPFAAAGWGFAAVEYTLAPAATIDVMVAEVRAAVAAVLEVVPGPVVLAGHSAGAQLVAMIAIADSPPPAVERIVLISGVLDLRELPRTSMNATLGLDAAAAQRLSPQLARVRCRVPVEVWWAERDTARFAEMSRDYLAHLRAGGCPATGRAFAGLHHFDVVDRLADLTSTR